MSDVDEYQELNFDDISADDFKNFEASDDIENAFNSTEFENMTFDEYADDGGVIEATGDMSGDFSFGEYSDGDLAAMFEGGDGDKQEPYFESQTENFSDGDTAFEDAFQFNENTEEEVVENYVENAFDENAATEDYITEAFDENVATEDYVTETFDGNVATEDYVTETFDENVATEDYPAEATEEQIFANDEISDELAEMPIASEESFTEASDASVMLEAPVAEMVDMPVENNDAVVADFSFDDNQSFDNDTIDNVSAFSVVTPQNLKYIKWYSGNSETDVYEFGKSSASGEFVGTRECNTIHVNVGYDTYGWVVQFSDGVVMSLRDVREYQIRNGKLPNNSGRIVYGQNILSFDNVERIVVYEAVKYFSYGM